MLLRVSHHTRYSFDAPVTGGLQQIRLIPKARTSQKIRSWQVEIEGGEKQAEFDDEHANRVILATIDDNAESVSIHCSGEVETQDTQGIIGEHGGFVPLWHFRSQTRTTKPGSQIRALAKSAGSIDAGDIPRLHNLSAQVLEAMTYDKDQTHSGTLAEDALPAGHGACQDHAHVFISAARLMGYPARYVSGYLMMDDRVEQDATHAWAEAHVNGVGWIGFDISNSISPDERYIRIATGLDYGECAPVTGIRYGASAEVMDVEIQVQQVGNQIQQ